MDTLLFNLIWIIPLFTVLVCAPISSQKESLLKTIHAVSGTFVLLLVGYLTYRLYTLGIDSAAKESSIGANVKIKAARNAGYSLEIDT